MNFHFIRCLWNELCVLYPRAFDEFHKYRMKWKFISDSFYHMIIPNNINIPWKNMYFEKIPRENRPEASCFMTSLAKERETSVKSVM